MKRGFASSTRIGLALAWAATTAHTATAAPLDDSRAGHYKIGIIGSGKVGGTLGTLWAKAGDEILFSSRHPEELKNLAARADPKARTGTPAEAAAFGDVVLIAVPYSAFPEIAKANGAALKGKVVLDASNAITGRDGSIVDAVKAKGIGAYSASLLPGAHLVRGFNAINYKNMAADSNRAGDSVAIPLAGDDPKAVAVGSDLVRQAGFVPVVVPLKRADEFGPGMPLGVGAYTAAQWKAKLGLAP